MRMHIGRAEADQGNRPLREKVVANKLPASIDSCFNGSGVKLARMRARCFSGATGARTPSADSRNFCRISE